MKMKLSARVKVMLLSMVFVAMLACSAWADVESVAQAINDYGLEAAVSGNTITVTGSKTDATEALVLSSVPDGMITYNWKATLTADCATFPPTWTNSENRSLILFDVQDDNDVIFNINGGEISFTDKNLVRPYDNEDFVNLIYNNPQGTPFAERVRVVLDGGFVRTDMLDAVAINVHSKEMNGARQGAGWLELKSGTLYAPFSEALEADNGRCAIDDSALESGKLKITGLVDGFGQDLRVYGNTTMSSVQTDEEYKWEEMSVTVMNEAVFTIAQNFTLGVQFSLIVENNAVLTIDGVKVSLNGEDSLLHIKKGGTLNLINGGDIYVNGEIIIDGIVNKSTAQRTISPRAADPNNGILNNSGTITVSPIGMITNNGIINNASTGTIRNEGKIVNAGTINNEGKIVNAGTINNEGKIGNADGTISNKGTIKSDPANFSGNEPEGNAVEPIDSTVTPPDNTITPPDNDDNDTPSNVNTSNGGSGGGCNAGYGMAVLLLAGLVTIKLRKA
jgi:hypothetical protein